MSALTAAVVITNYNYGRFLTDCINSVLSQTRAPAEIIVIDDGSTDNSLAVVKRFEPRIRIVQTSNQGQAAALARGISESQADVLCLLDADDVWTSDKIERTLQVFERDSRTQWLRHRLMVSDERLQPVGASIPVFRGDAPIPPRPLPIRERTITAATSALVVRSDAARTAFADFRNEQFFAWDADALLLATLTVMSAWGYSLDVVLGSYRRHGAQKFHADDDLKRLFERQLAVSGALGEVFGVESGCTVSDHKHRLLLATLAGQSRVHPVRVREVLNGTIAGVRALASDPALAIRQIGGLGLAFVAPQTWVNRFRRAQGLRAD